MILSTLAQIQEHGTMCIHIFSWSCIVFWTLTIVTLLWCIKGSFSPQTTVAGIPLPDTSFPKRAFPKGIFYWPCGFVYRGSFLRLFSKRQYGADFSTILTFYPVTEEEIYQELVFEHLKLCVIRKVKLSFRRWIIRFIFAWIIYATCSKWTYRSFEIVTTDIRSEQDFGQCIARRAVGFSTRWHHLRCLWGFQILSLRNRCRRRR